MGKLKKFYITSFAWGCDFMLAPHVSYYVVGILTAFCGVMSVWLYRTEISNGWNRMLSILKIGTEFQVPDISLGWVVAAVLLVAFVVWNPAKHWIQEQGKALQSSYALVRTKPICGSTCKNLDWIIETCKRKAVEIGRLKNLSLSDAKRATRYFRGCLIDKGMNWQKCEKGEAGCMRLRYFAPILGVTALPSFVEKLPDDEGEHDK